MSNDNLEIAMAAVASEIEPTIHRTTGAAPGEGTVQVIVRTTRNSRERWKQTADRLGISVAEMIRQLADAKATDLLDCTHPREVWRTNRWGTNCGKCGTELNRRR